MQGRFSSSSVMINLKIKSTLKILPRDQELTGYQRLRNAISQISTSQAYWEALDQLRCQGCYYERCIQSG